MAPKRKRDGFPVEQCTRLIPCIVEKGKRCNPYTLQCVEPRTIDDYVRKYTKKHGKPPSPHEGYDYSKSNRESLATFKERARQLRVGGRPAVSSEENIISGRRYQKQFEVELAAGPGLETHKYNARELKKWFAQRNKDGLPWTLPHSGTEISKNDDRIPTILQRADQQVIPSRRQLKKELLGNLPLQRTAVVENYKKILTEHMVWVKRKFRSDGGIYLHPTRTHRPRHVGGFFPKILDSIQSSFRVWYDARIDKERVVSGVLSLIRDEQTTPWLPPQTYPDSTLYDAEGNWNIHPTSAVTPPILLQLRTHPREGIPSTEFVLDIGFISDATSTRRLYMRMYIDSMRGSNNVIGRTWLFGGDGSTGVPMPVGDKVAVWRRLWRQLSRTGVSFYDGTPSGQPIDAKRSFAPLVYLLRAGIQFDTIKVGSAKQDPEHVAQALKQYWPSDVKQVNITWNTDMEST